MYISEDKVYLGGFTVILILELFMAVPLVTDSLIKDGSVMVVYVAIAHLLWYLFAKSGMVEDPLTIVHIFGGIGFIVSMFPVVGFIWHGLIVYMMVRYLIKKVKKDDGLKHKEE